MGYSVYWELLERRGEWQKTWPQLVEDAKLIIEAADVLVCGPTLEEFPRLYFNPVVDEVIDFYPPICNIDQGIWLNGLAEDGHEAFFLRKPHSGDSCKTLYKPYDLIVGCILLRAYQLEPDLTVVCSDGNWEENWAGIRKLYSELWPGQDLLRPPDLHGVDERPSDPSNPGTWLSTADIQLNVVSQEPKAVQLQSSDERKSNFSEFELDTRKATNVSAWLSHCDASVEHTLCKPSRFSWSPLPGVHFRLIDVKRRCIVRAPIAPVFAVISYVWGGVKQPMLTSATEQILAQEGGLDKTLWRPPNVINDAIEFCKSIGLKYLWVDALCIKQDSSKDLKLQIRRMRTIYAGAKVTFVAANGADANARLITNDSADTRSISVQELADVLSTSVWNTRGWTYQELVLSHRVVFCTSVGMYLVCQKNAVDLNGQLLPFSHSFLNSSLLLNKPGSSSGSAPNHQLHSYLHAVERYSHRSLSYPSDALNAFQGIIQSYRTTMDNNENAFYYGLPTCAFDQVFCFRLARHSPSTRCKDFPSWSWLGWSQPVRFDHEMLDKVRTWNMIHPPVLKDSHISWPNSIKWEDAGLKKLWRPIEPNPYKRLKNQYGEWGFPTAIDSFQNGPALSATVSIADLRIASEPRESDDTHGMYDVFPVRCVQTPPDPPPETISMWELLHRPIPKPYMPSEEEKRAPLIPATRQTIDSDAAHYAEDFHDSHRDCEAYTPIGYIRLDKAWRESMPKNCMMGFVALCGKKRKKAGWTITRLMLTERLKKIELVWGRARVHTMDCEITKDAWIRAGAKVLDQRFL